MNYRRIYLNLIEKAAAENGAVLYPHPRRSNNRNRKPGFEIHHKIPASWGGSDHPSNLVRLTYRQHFTAHHLLARLCGGSMWAAFFLMCGNEQGDTKRDYRVTQRQYQTARIESANYSRAANQGNQHCKGRTYTEELRSKISRSLKGYKQTPEHSAKIAAATKARMNNRPMVTCPHCGLTSRSVRMKRYHFDNCKQRQ